MTTGCHQEPPKTVDKAFPVTLGEAIEKEVPLYISTIGNVYSLQSVDIRPQVGGIIQEAYVSQGQYVKKGDPLYLIDPRPYQAALDKAKATLVKDKATVDFSNIRLKRYSELTKQDYFAKIDYEQFISDASTAEGQVLSDQADIETAALNLEWTKPISPLNGKISQYAIDVGNLVIANDSTALTNIRQIDPADIRFTINQKDFIEVQEALKAGRLKLEVSLPQYPNHPREGLLYFIDNHIDLATGSILLRGTVPNADEFFWPGEFIRVKLRLRTLPHAILVPQEAVLVGQDGEFIYVYNAEKSTVDYRRVTKGETIDEMVLIVEGLKAGEKVVVKGQVNLRPGVKVKVVTPATKS